jgi:hypothetical protein
VASSKKRPASELVDRGEEKATGLSVPKDDSAPFVYQLVNSLREYHDLIQGDPQASQSILQHQLSDKHPLCHLLIGGSTDSSDKRNGDEASAVHQFVYWLFLATHCLHKLVERGMASDGSAVTAAWLVHAVSDKLLVHLPAKQDRLTNAAARHVVGRALILVALAATDALVHLASALKTSSSSSHDDDTISALSSSMQACVLALDAVTMVHNTAGASGTSTATGAQVYWTRTAASWSRSMDLVWMEHAEIFQNLMATTEELDWSAERTAWHELGSHHHVEPLVASLSPVLAAATGKRASRRTSCATAATNAASLVAVEGSSEITSLLQTMETLVKLDATNKIGLDSRLAIKRWTAVGLTWYGISGQEKLLTAANLLLQQECTAIFPSCHRTVVLGPLLPLKQEEIETVPLELKSATENSMMMDDKETKKPKSKSKTTKSSDEETSHCDVPVPSNVTLMTLVCRLCRIVWEIGNVAGSRPPALGGYDTYMKSVTGTVVKKSSKLVRAELRDVAMSIGYFLIQRHDDCLRKNFGSQYDKLVVNEDVAEDYRRRIPLDSSKHVTGSDDIAPYESLYFYYPFVHGAIDELAQASAANAGGQSLIRWSDRIEFAVSAFVFLGQPQIMDARLTNYALEKLVSCLSTTTLASTSGLTADAATSSAIVVPPPAGMKSILKLDEPLPIPTLQQQPAKQGATRKRKGAASVSASAKESANFCSFAGVYDDRRKGTDRAATEELSCDEKLALFIRAARGESPLISRLIWIVEACYDTRTAEDPETLTTIGAREVYTGSTDGSKRKPTSNASARSHKRRKQGGNKPKAARDDVLETPYR